MDNVKFSIKVFGCQYNEWDAARLAFVLKNAGLAETDIEDADTVFLLNCSVRKTAVDRALSFTRNYIAKGQKVVIAGCVLQADRKKFLEKSALLWDGEDFDALSKLLKIELDKPYTLYSLPSTNFVPITKGCNNFCSYCAVPYTRGREVSRPMAEILNDVRSAIQAGNKEITLLGQNVNSYRNPSSVIPAQAGIQNSNESQRDPIAHEISRLDKSMARNDKQNKSDFAILLEEINALPGDFMVTFTSNHPKDMTDDIIDAIATLPKIEKSIHLPLQSGSNKILKAMNRPYTAEEYLQLVKSLKSKVHKVIITTDVIVGFPGETEEDFAETVLMFKKINFHQAYINKYSPREGTVAFRLGDPIPWKEKERRWRILNDLNKQRLD